jgi:hypothetical protein
MTRARRFLVVGGAALLILAIPVGSAVAAEIDDVLDEASESTYTATRLIVSMWGDQTRVGREFVEHANGMEMVRRDTSWSMAGNGKAASMGDEPAGFTFLTDQRGEPTSRYTIVERSKASHMSRPCQIVEVMEGDILRASLVVDDRSGAFLIQELYNESGDMYRRTTLSDFRAYRTYEAPMDEADVPMEIVMHEDSELLPQDVAGYQLVDVFSAPGASEQGYFTDGLFRFSLFVLGGRTVVTGFDDPRVFLADSGVYDIVTTPQTVRVHWEHGSSEYVLVGDLPPDHLSDILAELPAPNAGDMWSRWWQRLFG